MLSFSIIRLFVVDIVVSLVLSKSLSQSLMRRMLRNLIGEAVSYPAQENVEDFVLYDELYLFTLGEQYE